MRLAVAGKGGAGKTTLSATLARLAARSGRQVVAIDADANPNLASALGLPPSEAARLGPVPDITGLTPPRWSRPQRIPR
ncbi:MAG: AAA family ATPase [Nocardioidaceae bacterium]